MSDHLSTEILDGYRKRRLEPAELLEFDDHLARCAACRQVVREMMPVRTAVVKLRSSIESLPALEHRNPTRGWLGRLFMRPAGVAFAVAMTALLAIGAFAWLRIRQQRNEIVAHRPGVPPAPVKPAIVVALNEGASRITLDAEGNLAGLDFVSAEDRRLILAALTAEKVDLPQTLQEVRSSSSALMGSSPRRGFALLSPVGTIVDTARPTFRWRHFNGATAYQVTVIDPAAGYREVAASPELAATRWTADRPIAPGRTYAWQVTAQTSDGAVKVPDPASPEARFRVLESETAAKLEKAQKAYAGQHLVLGLLYAEAGLLEKAEAEFQALAKANPDSELARKFLRTVQTNRIDREGAAKLRTQNEADRLRQERDEVRAVLRSYGEAVARKDASQIAALWPSMPPQNLRDLRQSFRDFTSLKLELRPLGEPEISATSARVQCRRFADAVDRYGSHLTEGTVSVVFEKRNGRWVIDSIQ